MQSPEIKTAPLNLDIPHETRPHLLIMTLYLATPSNHDTIIILYVQYFESSHKEKLQNLKQCQQLLCDRTITLLRNLIAKDKVCMHAQRLIRMPSLIYYPHALSGQQGLAAADGDFGDLLPVHYVCG